MKFSSLSLLVLAAVLLFAPASPCATNGSSRQLSQADGSAQQPSQDTAPIYELRLVGNSITSISYQRHGSTEIGFQGTPLLATSKGHAKIENKNGQILIDAEFEGLVPAQRFGNEYFTYVLWAITPEGKPSNLGEVLLHGDKSKITATTPLQSFGLLVSAEPYFAVSQPSNVVVLQNVVLPNTTGTISQVNARYELLDRGQYRYNVAEENQSIATKSKVPLEVYEARNAVAIAQAVGAQHYAPDSYSKAQTDLANAESFETKHNHRAAAQSAREAVQDAADARQITIRKRDDERQAEQRAAAAARQAQAQAEAEAAAQKAQQEQAARAQAEQQAQAAAQAQQQAEQQAEQEAQARAQAQQQAEAAAQARQQAEQQAQQQQAAAQQAIRQQQQLRASLLEQFNRILPTTDTPRGLKVNLADVLFDTAKYDLKEPAREALAKLAGIVLSHPGLKLQVEGFTDSTGTENFNQTLSENRAGSVRAFLIAQGVDPTIVTAIGYGESNPVASNDTPQGRQQNRRVEILISGEIIGTKIGPSNQPQPSAQP
jgi:outer membrane protein OmpA-like peptidoglycan-associated protein